MDKIKLLVTVEKMDKEIRELIVYYQGVIEDLEKRLLFVPAIPYKRFIERLEKIIGDE